MNYEYTILFFDNSLTLLNLLIITGQRIKNSKTGFIFISYFAK